MAWVVPGPGSRVIHAGSQGQYGQVNVEVWGAAQSCHRPLEAAHILFLGSGEGEPFEQMLQSRI